MKRLLGICLTVAICAITLLIMLSWCTTEIIWDAEIRPGDWTVQVLAEGGIGNTNACVSVIMENGKVLTIDQNHDEKVTRSPIDNYTVPGSLCADRQGIIRIRISRPLRYGGVQWKALWLYPVGRGPNESPVPKTILISMGKCGSVIVPIDDLRKMHEVVITTPGCID